MRSNRAGRRQLLMAGVAMAANTGVLRGAAAQSFPSRPITMLLPLAVGSAGDVALRLVGQNMAESMKQPVVIENLPGAAGLLGTEKMVRAAPDGYMVGGLGDSILNFAANLSPKLNFDPVDGVQPVALVATIPWVLAAHPGFPARNLAGFVAAARAEPGKINYASTGMGSASHIGMEMLASQAGIRLNHVPYRGATPAVNDVVAGQVPLVFSAVSVVLPFIRSGRLVAYGVPASVRSPLLPEAPTFTEAGLPGFDFVTWVALFVPKGTPRPIVDQLNAETSRAIADPEIRDKLVAMGLEPKRSTPEELGEMVRTGHARAARIIRDANIKAE